MNWSELPYPWQVALEEAWAAAQAGSVPIGAVVMNANGTLLSRARNHIHDDDAPTGQVGRSELAHAELNALLQVAALSKDILHNATIYTTMEPCPLCLGTIYMSGVRTIRYAVRDPYAGSTNLLGSTPYLALKPVKAIGPDIPALETALTGLFFAALLNEDENYRASRFTHCWREHDPRGVALGEKLYDQGGYRWMIAHYDAQQWFNQQTELLKDAQYP